jgi:hypothetical protein
LPKDLIFVPPMDDIVKQAGVSVSTVSRVLSGANHAKRYRPDTHEKVIRASIQLGYKPNLPARVLAGGKTQIIAIVFPRYYVSALRGCLGIRVIVKVSPIYLTPQPPLHAWRGGVDSLFRGSLRGGEVSRNALEPDHFEFPNSL